MNVNELLKSAITYGASDVHITVASKPKYRCNGTLVESDFPIFTPNDVEQLVKSFMNEQQIAQIEEFGEVDFSFSIEKLGRFRANVFKQRGSYACSLRLVSSNIPDPTNLGLPESVVDLYKKRSGLILVTGPTGSGKSTSLAALINEMNKYRKDHIITLEDPIEYVHSHNNCLINQREIGLDSKSYSNALRASLRQDPDVILVGEMRDLDTISTAITAAETGHLVLSTLHTTGAVNTIDRIIDVFPHHQQQQVRIQLASVLVSVVSQLLLREKYGNGRVAAFEILHNNTATKNLIRENKTHQLYSILQTNKNNGMQTLDDALLNLVKSDKIDMEEALLYVTDTNSFKRRLI